MKDLLKLLLIPFTPVLGVLAALPFLFLNSWILWAAWTFIVEPILLVPHFTYLAWFGLVIVAGAFKLVFTKFTDDKKDFKENLNIVLGKVTMTGIWIFIIYIYHWIFTA